MTFKNPYYGRCVFLEWRYQKSTYIGNSHSKVVGWCKKYLCNIYFIKIKDGLPICCVNTSPYTKLNCKYFKDKTGQTQLELGV